MNTTTKKSLYVFGLPEVKGSNFKIAWVSAENYAQAGQKLNKVNSEYGNASLRWIYDIQLPETTQMLLACERADILAVW